jgi:hypothetical protein
MGKGKAAWWTSLGYGRDKGVPNSWSFNQESMNKGEGKPREALLSAETGTALMYLIGLYLISLHLIGMHLTGIYPMDGYLISVHLTGVCRTGVYLTVMHLISAHLMGVCLIGVYLIGMCLIDVYLMSVHLIGVYLIGGCLMGGPFMSVHLMRVSHRHVSHGRVPHKRASYWHTPYKHVLHERASHRRVSHRRVPHQRASQGREPQGRVPYWMCTSWTCISWAWCVLRLSDFSIWGFWEKVPHTIVFCSFRTRGKEESNSQPLSISRSQIWPTFELWSVTRFGFPREESCTCGPHAKSCFGSWAWTIRNGGMPHISKICCQHFSGNVCTISMRRISRENAQATYAARSMFRYTFRTAIDPFYDAKRKTLWYLGWKVGLQTCNHLLINSDNLPQGPKECEDPQLDVRATYYILQKSRYLQVYSKAKPRKKIAKFDMVEPRERQAFVDVWRLIPDRYPPPQTSARLKRKDLSRVQRLHKGGHQRNSSGELVFQPCSPHPRRQVAVAVYLTSSLSK